MTVLRAPMFNVTWFKVTWLKATYHDLPINKWTLGLITCLALVGCSGGNNNDQIRIGSGQSGNASTDATDYPIFYVKRTTPNMLTADDNMRHLLICTNNKLCNLNADLYLRDRASISASERNVTARVRKVATEIWDVKDVDVSADASKVIFAMRGPLTANQDPKKPPNWGIWEYVIANDDLHRIVIGDDIAGTGGQYIAPHYLPDGHILFASTRQTQSKAILLDELKPQFEAQDEDRHEAAFVLHIMDGNGQNITQVSFNQSHDLNPTVLANGRILFSRWDHAAGRNGIHLYTMNPDGTDTQLLYGSSSHSTVADLNPTTNTTTFPAVQFTQAREMSNGNTLVLVRPFLGTEYGGDLYIVDANTYVENTQATAANGGMPGPAQRKATPNNVRMLTGPSEGGRFVSAVPLWDGSNRILVSWTQCRVLDASNGNAIVPCTSSRLADATTVSAPPIYSVWMYDPADQTMQPVVVPTEGVMISDIAIAQPRTAPAYKPVSLSSDVNVNSTVGSQGVGILDVRSVYDFDGTVAGGISSIAAVANPTAPGYATRPARFLRIEKAVSLPDKDVRDVDFTTAFGVTAFMREILGYVPVEPDGSVQAKIPANVAFQISVTDSNGRRVSNFPRHNAWITLRPGETVQCNGCHTPSANLTAGQSGISHGRSGLFAQAYAGATNAGSTFTNANASFAAVNVRDTMAQARAAWSCANEQCASITPSVNVAFADVWPAAQGSWDLTLPGCATFSQAAYSRVDSTCRKGDFKLVYTGGTGVPKLPTGSACLTTWSNTCRITINYLEHIQPIWDLARVTTNPSTGAVLTDHTCTTCHNRANAAGAAQVAAGQLDLTNGTSDGSQQVNSYEELLRTHRQQRLNGAALEDICLVQTIDPVTGLPTGCTTFATVSPSLLARNAAGSRFFTVFSNNQCLHADGTTSTCSVNHSGYLTSGELRLISEWVDIGAQYFNDPFKAPVN
jgi:hypothetical protein